MTEDLVFTDYYVNNQKGDIFIEVRPVIKSDAITTPLGTAYFKQLRTFTIVDAVFIAHDDTEGIEVPLSIDDLQRSELTVDIILTKIQEQL